MERASRDTLPICTN